MRVEINEMGSEKEFLWVNACEFSDGAFGERAWI